MQYRLRTLLIVLALGPPVLAVAWSFAESFPLFASLLAIAYVPLLGMVGVASWLDRTEPLRSI